jgi:hypothetical protein
MKRFQKDGKYKKRPGQQLNKWVKYYSQVFILRKNKKCSNPSYGHAIERNCLDDDIDVSIVINDPENYFDDKNDNDDFHHGMNDILTPGNHHWPKGIKLFFSTN